MPNNFHNMNYRKPLIVMTAAAGVVLGAVATSPAALADTAQPKLTAGSASNATGDVSPAAVHRGSFTCSSPKGQNLNISWSPGTTSVTVYYNNHCSQSRHLKVNLAARTDVCFTVSAKTKSSKKVSNKFGAVVQSVTSPAKC